MGDVVIFERISTYEYRLHLERPDGIRISGDNRITQENERLRRWALRETRPEQQNFRRKIAERDGLKCAITGCSISEILDAAHLAPRAPGGSDDPANGMILRADIHRLFDAGLLAIDAAGTVSVSIEVTDPEYRSLHDTAASTGADLADFAARAIAIAGA
ncbi:HNH endonuclease [Thioclava sp. NG1]|uniref:HNH endonuclease n=1 Tax=Thioclava sp. NG1 TaxID=2182426 RepID=UPI001304F891|nr:HNH endonuclease signature motif containing protein [Thioclava sp. NG1]